METVEVNGRRTDESGRWIRLQLSLRPKRSGPMVTYRADFVCNLRPADALAATYELQNWQSGIMSGLGFALRRTADREWGVEVAALEGDVGSDDMGAIARAATIAAFRLHGQEAPALIDNDWHFESRTGTAVARADGALDASHPMPPPASVS
jgi:hypothetical protein